VELNQFDLPIVPAAVSDRDGLGVILDTEEEHELSATMDETGAVLAGRPRKEVPVQVTQLDTLVSAGTIRPPDRIKIDVEGHETAVLRGMKNQLERKRPALLIEVLTSGAADQVDRLTRPFGYVVYRLDQDGPRRLDAVAPAPGTNLFMCSPETAESLIENPENATAPTA
jgi:FkbM family methyltransferase